MKLFFFTALVLLFSVSMYGQGEAGNGYCGTIELSAEQEHFLDNFHANLDSYQSRGLGVTYYIPVQIHIVGDDNGSGYYRKQDVMTAMCELNEHFLPVGFHFYLKGDFNYINNTSYYVHDFAAGGNMMSQNNVSKVLNIYFVADPAGNCGYFSPAKDAIAIKNTCANTGETTIAHEIGHYFSLPHTFNGWESGTPTNNKKERADGSNCATTADRFCDTPADYLANRWNCPYNGNTLLDPVGDTVKPDGTLYMSYANDACTDRFSNQQMISMRNYLLNNRSNLISGTQPSIATLDTTTLVFPVNNAIDVPNDYVLLQWRKVPNAESYHVNLSRFSNFVVSQLDVITSDTMALAMGLLEGINYKWKVKPIMPSNTCVDYSSVWKFTAGAPTGISPEMSAAINLKAFPDPVFRGTPVTIEWNKAIRGEGQVEIFSLEGRSMGAERIQFDPSNARYELGTSNLNPGIYFVRVAIKNQSGIVRLIVF